MNSRLPRREHIGLFFKRCPRHDVPGCPTCRRCMVRHLSSGSTPVADEIARRWKSTGFKLYRIAIPESQDQLDAALDRIWQQDDTPHLFITTPHDPAARWGTSDFSSWSCRRTEALTGPYRICQRWMQAMIDQDRMHQASVLSFLNAGGTLGFQNLGFQNHGAEAIGNLDHLQDASAESGGIAGLTKAMLIESWMRGFRDTPMLVLDAIAGATPAEIVEGAWRELAVPSYDEEVIVGGNQRLTLKACYQPIERIESAQQYPTRYPLTKGGTWIVAGGGRGITAMTAMELASRHGLKLHLLGMAKAEPIDAQTRQHAMEDRDALRRKTMNRVQKQGTNPFKYWRQFEKAIEIDQTLQECRRRGIEASYHSVDVSDANALEMLFDDIRRESGPIRGVIQGAGSGQDARFDRKRPDKVHQCLSAKIDGCASLAAATKRDPLEWFIGFGSISGRFGANGHTDYSAANEMLAKMIGRLGLERPTTRCVTFHWHAWGDVGMATKPEAKLALDMIGMEFMPAQEGLEHFVDEIECGGDNTEVLITDRRYLRKFFPGVFIRSYSADQDPKNFVAPMLNPSEKAWSELYGSQAEIAGSNASLTADSFAVTLFPDRDLFLKEHRVGLRPTLPFAVAIEMLGEAAARQQCVIGNPTRVRGFSDLRAVRPLKCLTDDAFAVELISESQGDGAFTWKLVKDLRRRDGRVVEPRREHFRGRVLFQDAEFDDVTSWIPQPLLEEVCAAAKERPSEQPVAYLDEDAPVYHGSPLRCLRSIRFEPGRNSSSNNGYRGLGLEESIAVGTIVAPSPAHLAGESRPLVGWVICPATLDAVLYAAGMFAFHQGGRPSLPVRFGSLVLGRNPDPGEPLRVVLRWMPERLETGGILQGALIGQNRDLILGMTDYEVGWLS